MSRPVRNERHEDRPGAWDPYFTGSPSVPGYSVPSSIDPTGFTLSDPGAYSTLPDRYGVDPSLHSVQAQPVVGSAVPGGLAGAASTHGQLGMDGLAGEFAGPVHANKGAPIDYGVGVGPEHSISDLDTGSLYDGGGWPEAQPGSFRGPGRAARARSIRQELSSVDDYGDQRNPVDDLGRPVPGPLRSSQRGTPSP